MIDMNDPGMKQALKLTEEAVEAQAQMIDRGDAVNLARNLNDEMRMPTLCGVEILVKAVLAMDEYIRQSEAVEQMATEIGKLLNASAFALATLRNTLDGMKDGHQDCTAVMQSIIYLEDAMQPSKAERRAEISAHGSEKLYVGRFAAKWLTVHVDPSLPDDVIEIRAPGSDHVLGRIVNVALADHSPDRSEESK